MQIPTADSYKNYITWPESLDGARNQIIDGNNVTGIKFLEGTPRSLTVEIVNVDNSGRIMVFDFIFDKETYSTVRVSRLIDQAESLVTDPEGKMTRLDFFKLFADTTIPFHTVPHGIINGKQNPGEIFSDLGNVSAIDVEKLKPLKDIYKTIGLGIVKGYPDGTFRPNEYAAKKEVLNMLQKTMECY